MKYLSIVLILFSFFSCSESTADKFYSGDKDIYVKFANTIDSLAIKEVSIDDMTIMGFNGYSQELLFVNYLMASLGYGQIMMQYPELKERYISKMEYCIDKMINDPKIKEFDSWAWEGDPVQAVLNGTNKAHGAYLCWVNIALSMHRYIDKNSKYADLNDAVTKHLMKKISHSKYGAIETYPEDYYPADMSVALGSIGLYAKATRTDLTEFISTSMKKFNKYFRNDTTGLVYQNIYITEENEIYQYDPRGASTVLSAYMLSFIDKNLSEDLFKSVEKYLYEDKWLYAGIREYQQGVAGGMDGDSGPIINGLSVSASGFALSAAKIYKDKEMFKQLYKTASLVGGGTESEHNFAFSRGGFIGNTILFAMLTANMPKY